MQAAVFGALGEDADWEGVATPVRVRRREYDEDNRYEQGSVLLTVRYIRVRQSEVASPEEGQTIQILDRDGVPVDGELYQVDGEPVLDRKKVWTCPVKLSA